MSGIDLSVVSVTDLVVATSIQDLYLVDSGYLKKRCQQKETQTPGSRFFCLFVCLFVCFVLFFWLVLYSQKPKSTRVGVYQEESGQLSCDGFKI